MSRVGVPEAAAGSGVRKGFLAFALTARGAITLWLVYVAANALVRYSLSHTLSNDDVSESLLVQTFRLGYSPRNPPLWEWLLWTLQQAVGPGYESHWLMRYGCIALFGIAIFRVSRLASNDIRWSAVVTLSSPLLYQIGWPFLDWGTHSLLLLVILLFSLEVVIRYALSPSASLAILLGALVGLGVLAKFGYAVFAVAALVALLAQRETRAAVLRREFLLVPLVAGLVLSPFGYWLLATQADLAATAQATFRLDHTPHVQRSLFGLMKLVENSIEFLMPWAAIAGLSIWMARRAGLKATTRAGPGEDILRRLLAVSVAMTIVGVIAIGPTNFSSGYVVPVLVAAIPYSACLLSRHVPDAAAAERFAALSISVLVVIVLLRLLLLSNSGFPEFSYRREMWPIAGLAEEMRAAGIDRGTLVTIGTRDGGNIRLELPEMRVVTVGQDEQARPPIRPEHEGVCHLLWNQTETIAPGERWAQTGDRRIASRLPQIAGSEPRHFDIPWAPTLLGNARTSRWTMVRLDPDDPLCR
jgi:4-amino-4-deoxy-L-arabinose transferase-like glycosyltransferase